MKDIAVVIPVYQAKDSLQPLTDELIPVIEQMTKDFEILLVDDGSSDGSWNLIVGLSERDSRIKGVRLIRNFGEHVAITVGLERVDAEHTVVMACDLQDDPATIPAMVAKARQGFDLVLVRRLKRQDAYIKRTLARLFYFVVRLLFDVEYDHRVGTLRLLSRRAVQYFCKHRERIRNVNAIMALMRLPTAYVNMTHRARLAGRSTYTTRRSALMAANVLIVYSEIPLLFSAFLGATLLLGAVVVALVIGARMAQGVSVSELAVALTYVTALAGLVLINMGIVGAYLGRAATEARERPLYFISTTAPGSARFHRGWRACGQRVAKADTPWMAASAPRSLG